MICELIAAWGDDYNWVRDLMRDASDTAFCENDLNFALVALRLGLDDPERFLPPPPRSRRDLDDSDWDSETGSGSGYAGEDNEDFDEHRVASEGEDEDSGVDSEDDDGVEDDKRDRRLRRG